jgi:DegV family protein with EDD domain
MDTLHYLYKGGRLSRTGHIAGTLLNFKPIIMLKDGQISVVGKARGVANGVRKLLDEAVQTGIDLSRPVYLGYTDTEKTCLLLQQQVAERLSLDHAPIFPIGSVVGTHAGPGACAIAFFKK